MPYTREKELYPLVCNWLENFLKDRHRKAAIKVFDASKKSLTRLIKEQNLFQHLRPEWVSWDIQVDVVGFILYKQRTEIAFVKCKNHAITFNNLSQLLGYSRVVIPEYAFLIAPQGISDSLKSLLLTYLSLEFE